MENRFPNDVCEPGCTVALSSKDMPCPVCGRPVVSLRNELRCIRCAFVFCAGCDGTFAVEFDEDR
jgi:hypothetical protein